MIYFKIKGIVIYKERVKENDANVYILTKKDGILKIYVQGLFKIKSKNLPLLQIGNYLQVFGLKEGDNLKLISVLPLKTRYLYFKKYSYLYLWSFFLLKKISLLETDDFIWKIYTNLEKFITKKNFPHYLIFHLLRVLGFEPEISKCFKCQRKLKKEIYFDGKQALFCKFCKKPAYQKIPYLEWLKALKIKSKNKVPEEVPSFLKIIIKTYFKNLKRLS
jgi:DNA repair protein RecO